MENSENRDRERTRRSRARCISGQALTNKLSFSLGSRKIVTLDASAWISEKMRAPYASPGGGSVTRKKTNDGINKISFGRRVAGTGRARKQQPYTHHASSPTLSTTAGAKWMECGHLWWQSWQKVITASIYSVIPRWNLLRKLHPMMWHSIQLFVTP